MTARQRRRRKRKAKRAAAWALVYIFEVLMSAVPTAITAAVLIPWAAAERGYYAAGGEWLAVAFVFYISYVAIHNAVCDKIYGKEER